MSGFFFDCRDQLAKQAWLARMWWWKLARLAALSAPLEHLAQLGGKVQPAHLVHVVNPAQQEILDRLPILAHPALLAMPVPQAIPECPAVQANQARN